MATARLPVVFACGQPFRGDDAVAFEIVAALDEQARNAATVVEGGALDVAQLVALAEDARCIVVDAVAGIAPGAVIELDLEELASAERPDGMPGWARSTHELPIPQALRLARALCGRPITGTLLGVGIAQCVPGTPLSTHVAEAVPPAARSLSQLIERHAAHANLRC